MATVNYNPADMETVIANSTTISTNITSTADAIDGVISGVDTRVYDYFEFFKEMNEKSSALRWEETNANGFGSWMSDTYDEFKNVRGDVVGNSGKGVPDLTLPEAHEKFPSINVDPSKVTPYDLTSEAWEKFSTEDKKAIEAKLKELGFTDEEIQAIKDGNASVNKTTLDKLDSALTKLNNEGSDVRQVILEKYGFDVFNEDGTINKDKLALAMLIDNKNPNDDYDLVALLKNKYGIDLFPDTTTNPGNGTDPGPTTNPDVTPTGDNENDNGSNPNPIHTGVGYGGAGSENGEATDVSEIEGMLNGDEDESLLDGLGNLTGSVLNRKDGFDIGFNKGDGKAGGIGAAGVAGIAGLGAAATAAGLLAKKKKEDAILGDDDDDDFDDDLDEDNLDEDDLLKDFDDEDDDNDSINKNKKKKDWLYGLGIGLAGAGLAAGLIAKDDDDDEDEEDDD